MSELKERFLAVYKETVTREGSDSLLDWLEHSDFFVAPASTRYHGCYEGGLLQHSLKVLIVTTSNYHTLASKMERVLFKYFPFLTWNDVIITSHKQLVNGDVLIDDGTHNLEGGNYFKILMTAQHNKKYDAEANGMLRVETWAEVYSAITLLAEEDDLKGWKEVPMEITLYSTGCPKCKVLKKKLEEKGIKYTESNSVDEMLSLGISQVPVLSVNNELLDFSTANDWVNQQ